MEITPIEKTVVEEVYYCPIHTIVKPLCECPTIHSIGFIEYTYTEDDGLV